MATAKNTYPHLSASDLSSIILKGNYTLKVFCNNDINFKPEVYFMIKNVLIFYIYLFPFRQIMHVSFQYIKDYKNSFKDIEIEKKSGFPLFPNVFLIYV